MNRKLFILWAASLVTAVAACSLIVDTEECAADGDCTRFNANGVTYTCLENACVASAPQCIIKNDCPSNQDCVGNVCVAAVEDDMGQTDVGLDEGDDMGTDMTSDNEVVIREAIRADTTWNPDKTYILDGVIYVEAQKRLVINAGTVIKGRAGSALVIKRGGRLESRGNVNAPVIFTSAQPEGSRLPGDWGGVALAGEAPTNKPNALLEGVVDSIVYGGSVEDSSCGVIEFTRIEFAGFKLDQNKELNGLTLAGCGSGTSVNHVQVHAGSDDGIEIFGGSVDLQNIVISRAQDDGVDWDMGWQGSIQFLVIQQDETGDNGFESSNNPDDDDAMPRANPRIYNYTIIGSNQQRSQRGMTLKEGTAGQLVNGIIMGSPLEAIDILNAATATQATTDALVVKNTLFYGIGANGSHYFPTAAEEVDMDDDDGGFDEDAHFRQAGYNNVFGVDPGLGDAFNLTNPNWVPTPPSPTSMNAARPPQGFDEAAQYLGAFAPGGTDWTTGWTSYPEG